MPGGSPLTFPHLPGGIGGLSLHQTTSPPATKQRPLGAALCGSGAGRPVWGASPPGPPGCPAFVAVAGFL